MRISKVFQLEKGDHPNYEKENIPLLEKENHFNLKIFQLEKGTHSN